MWRCRLSVTFSPKRSYSLNPYTSTNLYKLYIHQKFKSTWFYESLFSTYGHNFFKIYEKFQNYRYKIRQWGGKIKNLKKVGREFFKITHLFFLQCLVAPIPHLYIFNCPIRSLCCCFIDMWFPCRALLFAPRLRRRPPPGGLFGTSHLGWAE